MTAIPQEIRDGVLEVLPDRSGYVVLLAQGDNVPCPACGRAMAFAVLVQTAGVWSCRCFSCGGR